MRFAGGRELEAALGQIAKQATRRNVGRRALRAAGEPILQAMIDKAPDDPRTNGENDLKTSLAMSSRQKSRRGGTYRPEGPKEVTVHIGPTKSGYPQAMMQEFGTVHHPPQAYIRPAWDAEGGEAALDRIGEALGEEIGKAVKRQERRAQRAAARAGR